MLTFRRLLFPLALAALVLGILPALPASAHSVSKEVGTQGLRRGTGYIDSVHGYIEVCDTLADNWGVRIHYLTSTGGSGLKGDANGSAGGCGSLQLAWPEHFTFATLCTGVNGADTACVVLHDWI